MNAPRRWIFLIILLVLGAVVLLSLTFWAAGNPSRQALVTPLVKGYVCAAPLCGVIRFAWDRKTALTVFYTVLHLLLVLVFFLLPEMGLLPMMGQP